jgi:hypothetical protein
MPIKKYRDVNLNRPRQLAPRLRSYELQAPRANYDRLLIAVEHRQHGRVVCRHTLAESCECCEWVGERQNKPEKRGARK